MNDFLIDLGTARDSEVAAEERIPANWEITYEGEDSVSAVNKVTGKKFSGSAADFNFTYMSEFN